MSRIGDARSDLYTALQEAAVVHGLGSWRVHKYEPANVAAPSVWIGAHQLRPYTVGSPGVSMTLLGLPVYLCVDGLERRQVEQLDLMGGVVWDACETAGANPLDARPTRLDSGGPSLRAVVTLAEFSIRARTLCPALVLEGTAHG